MYIQRSLAAAIKEASSTFRVILLTGPRQVGKTTLLEHIEKGQRSYVTLDDMNQRMAAKQDPAGFIERLQLPVLIDEVQYAPELFPYIKIKVDQDKQPGQFWLTGSQQFEMMGQVTESLAGRIAILKLQGLSLAEEQGRYNEKPFLPTLGVLKARQKDTDVLGLTAVFEKIWRGSYPDVVKSQGKHWQRFYESYVSTYVQRDIRDLLQIQDQTVFHKFMQIVAARTGQLINYSDVARDVGVSEPTIKTWLNVLHATGIVYLLQPYFNNQTKRLIKTPKLYFMDTGLCCFLTGWLNADVLERGAMSGAILETYVISEVIKSYINAGQTPRLYFYRDKDKREIDLLIEENGTLYPVEIEKASTVKPGALKAFEVLNQLNIPVGQGAVICMSNAWVPLSKTIDLIPVSCI
ncbi:MAG: ATP-binding protein [Coxiellaceae bacterium]|nr:ATP-binding protein [Coxiellaceae bacterium]